MQVSDGVSGLHSGCCAVDGLPGGKSTNDSVSLPVGFTFERTTLHRFWLTRPCHSLNSFSASSGGSHMLHYFITVRPSLMLALAAIQDAPASKLAA